MLCLHRVGQEDNKKLSDYQMNTIKQKSLDLKNQFDTLFYDVDCDSSDFKSESKDITRITIDNNSLALVDRLVRINDES